MKITVKITKDVLYASLGCQRKSSDCLISRAVRDILPNAITFGHSIFYNGLKGEGGYEDTLRKRHKHINLPDVAHSLMNDFDRTESVEEVLALPLISFEIDVPNEVIDMIGIGQVYKVLSESKTLELSKI